MIKIIRLLFILFLTSNVPSVFASHVIGSEMTYTCTTSPQVYRVQFKIYRDCNGIQLCANCPSSLSPACNINLQLSGAEVPIGANLPASTCVGQNFGNQAISVVTAVSGFDVVQLCDLQKTVCSNCGTRSPGSFTPGIEVYVFEGNVNLASIPSSCCLVNIGYSSCCRNNAISTLVNPAGLNFYSQVTINRCVSPCNSGPILTNPPVFLACASQEFMTHLGAIDPDGDSLSYAFGRTLTAANTLAPYVSPFSPSVPFPYAGFPNQFPSSDPQNGIHINPVTGDIRFRPVGEFVSNLVVEVRQWKNVAGLPTLMGVSARDIQFYSRNCTNYSRPQLQVFTSDTAIKDTAHFTVCAGNTICFTVSAKDSLAAWDTTNLSWNAPPSLTVKGATFKKLYADSLRAVNGPKYDSMQFCWTPPDNMASNLPHYFIITAKDKTCPVPNLHTKSFSVLVRRIPTASIRKTNKNCGYFDFSYLQTNTVPVNALATQFFIEREPGSHNYDTIKTTSVLNHRFIQGGWYRIGLHLQSISPPNPNACSGQYWDSVLVQAPIQVNIKSKECVSNGVRIRAGGKFGIPYGTTYRYTFYKGKFGSNQIIRSFGIDSNYTIPTSVLRSDSLFYVVIQDLNGCKDSVAFVVSSTHFLVSRPRFEYDFCTGILDSIEVKDTSFFIQSCRWRSSNVLTDSLSKRIMPSGAGLYFVDKSNGNSCVVTDTILVKFSMPIQVKLKVENNPNACEGNVKILSVFNPFYNYQWYRNYTDLINYKNFDLLPENSGAYHVKILDEGLCIRYSDTLFVPVLPKPYINPIWGKTVQLDTINVFTYFVFYKPNIRFEWHFFNAQALGKTDTTFVDIRFQNFGMAHVLSKIIDTNNCERETVLELFVDKTSGLNQIIKNANCLIYPNPAKDVLHVEISNVLPSQLHYFRLFNKLGQTVYQESSSEKHLQISLANLTSDNYYILEISNENKERLASYKVFVER